jgi:hypothetical protein
MQRRQRHERKNHPPACRRPMWLHGFWDFGFVWDLIWDVGFAILAAIWSWPRAKLRLRTCFEIAVGRALLPHP